MFSVVVYHGQFGEAYETLNRVRARGATAQAPGSDPGTGTGSDPGDLYRLHRRAVRAAGLGVTDFGWPIVLLAGAGIWRAWSGGGRDRLTLVLAAVGLTYLAFVAMSVAAPVEAGFLRYADEFISRVDYATIPAVVILAALGAAWAWRAGTMLRIASAGLVIAAGFSGVQRWIAWLG